MKYELTISNTNKSELYSDEQSCKKITTKAKYVINSSLFPPYDTMSCNKCTSKYINLASSSSNIFAKALSEAINVENVSLRSNVVDFLRCFVRLVGENNELCDRLSPLKISVEDDSVFLEWVFRDFRIGFTIMEKDKESMWFFVSNKNMREKTFSEMFSKSEYQCAARTALKYALENT